jgi:hypothetical protein
VSENQQAIVVPDTRFDAENRQKSFAPNELAKDAGPQRDCSLSVTRPELERLSLLALWI